MTLYRDPKVTFGGMEVGGIRISHMSHIDRELVIALTATKKTRKPYVVKVLETVANDAPKPEGLPIIAPDGVKLAQRTPDAWLASVKNALAQTKDVGAWATAMEPHLRSIYAAGHEALVADAREAIQARRDAA